VGTRDDDWNINPRTIIADLIQCISRFDSLSHIQVPSYPLSAGGIPHTEATSTGCGEKAGKNPPRQSTTTAEMELRTSAQLTTMSSSTIQPGHTQAFENAIEVQAQSPVTYAADLKWEWSVGSGMYKPRYKPIQGMSIDKILQLRMEATSPQSSFAQPLHTSSARIQQPTMAAPCRSRCN
jgi:hypothetical protein